MGSHYPFDFRLRLVKLHTEESIPAYRTYKLHFPAGAVYVKGG